MLPDEVVAQRIKLCRGDARLDVRRDHVERFGGQLAGRAHAGEVFRAVHGNPPSVCSAVHRRRPVCCRTVKMRKQAAGCKVYKRVTVRRYP